MKKIVCFIAWCMFLLILQGCSVEPAQQAGGDDFPNMIAQAGRKIADNLDQKWLNPAEASSIRINTIDEAAATLGSLENALGKKSYFTKKKACNDSTWISIDLSSRRITVFSLKCSDTVVKNDTLVITVNGEDTSLISLRGASVQTVAPYYVIHYYCEDMDGDSVIFRVGAKKQQTRFIVNRKLIGGRTETVDIGYDGGNDGNLFTDDDNKVIFASATITIGNDTVEIISIKDADGDGYITKGKTEIDSNIVDIFVKKGRPDQSLLSISSTTTARMVTFPHDSTKDYAIRYSVTNRLAGLVVSWNIITVEGDSTFYPGDTVDVIRCTQPLYSDSLESDTLILRAVLGKSPTDSIDDFITGIYLHSTLRFGADRELTLNYRAAEPIPSGQKPQDGTIFLRIVNRNGAWIEVDGTISGDTISAKVITSNDKRYEVKWNAQGETLSIRSL